MSARADWYCMLCDEVMELPLKASACPVCAGLLERRFTPPMIGSDFSKKVDAIAEPALSGAPAGQRTPAPMLPPERQSRSLAAGAALGMVPGQSVGFSRGVTTPLIGALRGRGPRPGPGSKYD